MGLVIRVLTAVLLSALMACAPTQKKSQFPQVQLPPERSPHQGYSLVPLNEKGWVIVQSDHNKLVLKRKVDRQGEIYVIKALVLKLPTLTTQSDFMNYINEQRTGGANLARFNYMKRYNVPYSKSGTFCARSYKMVEDRAAVTRPGVVENMILEIVSLTCKHPANANVAIDIGYSHRHHLGQRDPLLSEKAEVLFESLEFMDIR